MKKLSKPETQLKKNSVTYKTGCTLPIVTLKTSLKSPFGISVKWEKHKSIISYMSFNKSHYTLNATKI